MVMLRNVGRTRHCLIGMEIVGVIYASISTIAGQEGG
jgi:hypothetical protein